jgi:hypothetical protein
LFCVPHRFTMAEYRLTFLLPASISEPAGVHAPCLGVFLTVGHGGLVTVEGPSRERVFDQAARFLRVAGKGHAPIAIAAVLRSPCGRADGWQAILGADVAFAPCSIDPHLPAAAE